MINAAIIVAAVFVFAGILDVCLDALLPPR